MRLRYCQTKRILMLSLSKHEDAAPYCRKVMRSDSISNQMSRKITVAIAVVTANFRTRRGLSGALVAWPASGLSGGRLPQGRTAKSTIHQTMT